MDSEEEEQSSQYSSPPSSPSTSPPTSPPSSPSDMYLVGFVIANIVGMKHCPGNIYGREMVALVREPLNAHDPNAIQVFNTKTIHAGYIQRSVAAVLSPLIDTQLIIVEAIVPSSRPSLNQIPCQIHIFSHFNNFKAVEDAVSEGNLDLITRSDPSFTLSDSVAVKETRTEKKFKSIDAIFKLVGDNNNNNDNNRVVRTLEPPRSIIKSELLQHQKEGLAWLVLRETSSELPPFWEEREGEFVNILTDFKTDQRPEPLRGGILADDMGLGKTLTLLSLIAFDKSNGFGICKKSRKAVVGLQKKRRRESENDMKTNATLVVCPASIMSTWITQLEEHTVKGALKTCMYYGERRTKNAQELKMCDLVLTTYSTLSNDHRMPEMPANKMEWRRIVLDEAHTIKNFKSQQSRAVHKLNALSRWAVTGTPIQNGCIDLYSLMVFLRFQPFSDRRSWRTLVQRPLNQCKDSGLSRLQVLMGAIALRRTKDMGLLELPPKTIEICYVELSSEQRKIYDQVKERAKSVLLNNFRPNPLESRYPAVLNGILQLRQICTDLKLCPSYNKSLFPSYDIEDVSNKPELLQKLLGLLQDGEDFDCPICISPPTEVVITCCAHIFCPDCILRTLQRDNPRCPLCRHTLSKSDLFSAPPESFNTDSAEPSLLETKLSPKVSTLIKLLTESRDQNPDSKSVVFSQFRKMLKLLEELLNATGFKTLRLDGTMNAKHRVQVIEQFQTQGREGPVVLLASLRASSAGINLTAASTVYFMEPWWNHAVEEQAMDRVHRIGQKEAVKVVRLIAQDSIEEKTLMLQEKRKHLPRESYGCGLNGMPFGDLRFLLDV